MLVPQIMQFVISFLECLFHNVQISLRLLKKQIVISKYTKTAFHTIPAYFESGEKCDGYSSRSHENGTLFARKF